jgi:hypothetical protein
MQNQARDDLEANLTQSGRGLAYDGKVEVFSGVTRAAQEGTCIRYSPRATREEQGVLCEGLPHLNSGVIRWLS